MLDLGGYDDVFYVQGTKLPKADLIERTCSPV